jgi:hypothetical protein
VARPTLLKRRCPGGPTRASPASERFMLKHDVSSRGKRRGALVICDRYRSKRLTIRLIRSLCERESASAHGLSWPRAEGALDRRHHSAR